MLNKPAEFAAFRTGSRFRASPLMSVRVRRSNLPGVRFGLATGKDLGGAVERNRVRRQLRAAIRALTLRLVAGSDILIIARRAATQTTGTEITAALTNLLAATGAISAPVEPAKSVSRIPSPTPR